ncbi:WxL domain-containing protein [Vagococcus hydrophili]|uniref:WxL domain-containing protein n=1 Tax=Vagococcus hydrophili TaxID=2714947 RepID=A0A6G8ATB2_9ENTE|nr:WxL domain-containing protein [Vagococcus hydrophili]QIL48236.1 hypothetical protein G7082_06900 [Vagococcus hydrophili]
MKKNILAAALLSGLVLSIAAPTALAVEDKDGKSVETSKVEVKLNKDDGHEPGTGPFKDKLAIVHKPTIFKFEGDTTTGSLNLKNKHPEKAKQFISVNDDRKNDKKEAISSPWTLTGQLSEVKEGTKTLAGTMDFKTSELQQYDIGELVTKPNGVQDYAPAAIKADAAKADATKYTLQPKFSLDAAGTAVKFLESTNTDVTDPHGVFTNLGDVDFNVASGNASEAGTYDGTITWTLAAQK